VQQYTHSETFVHVYFALIVSLVSAKLDFLYQTAETMGSAGKYTTPCCYSAARAACSTDRQIGEALQSKLNTDRYYKMAQQHLLLKHTRKQPAGSSLPVQLLRRIHVLRLALHRRCMVGRRSHNFLACHRPQFRPSPSIVASGTLMCSS
jgi:hypothetical protein